MYIHSAGSSMQRIRGSCGLAGCGGRDIKTVSLSFVCSGEGCRCVDTGLWGHGDQEIT